MKLNLTKVSALESEYKVTALLTIQKTTPYLYAKIKQKYPDKVIYLDLSLDNGGVYKLPVVTNLDLSSITGNTGELIFGKRGYMGRPYAFCAGCEKKGTCTLEEPCTLRDEYFAQKALKEARKDDERFWSNGTPKKNLILCEYAKYKYAHKRTAGQCQGEKCRFYEAGGCALDKEAFKEYDDFVHSKY